MLLPFEDDIHPFVVPLAVQGAFASLLCSMDLAGIAWVFPAVEVAAGIVAVGEVVGLLLLESRHPQWVGKLHYHLALAGQTKAFDQASSGAVAGDVEEHDPCAVPFPGMVREIALLRTEDSSFASYLKDWLDNESKEGEQKL